MINNDVNFDEGSRWNQEELEGKSPKCELDEGTSKEFTEQTEHNDTRENDLTPTEENSPHDSSMYAPNLPHRRRGTKPSDDSSFRAHTCRNKRNPTWMGDFVITSDLFSDEDLYDESEMHSLIVFDSPIDPIHCEEAVKHDKLRKDMDTEIQSIVKNEIWELVDLPTNANKIGVKYRIEYNE